MTATIDPRPRAAKRRAQRATEPTAIPEEITPPGVTPGMHIDHVVQRGNAFAVIGWIKGTVELSASCAGEPLPVTVSHTRRPDVEAHHGLGADECAGFYVELESASPWLLFAHGPNGETVVETVISEGRPLEDLKAVLAEQQSLGVDTSLFTRSVMFAGRRYRYEDVVEQGVGGHIEIPLVSEDGTAAFVGWCTDSPAHHLVIAVGDAVLSLRDCYRFPRADIQPVFYESLGASSGAAGFAGVLNASPAAAGDAVEVLLLDDAAGTARPLNWRAELHAVASEELPRRLAHVWTEPADLKARIERVEGRMPMGRRSPATLAARWVGETEAQAGDGPSIVVLWRRPIRLLAALAPVIAHAWATRPRQVLVVNVGLEAETVSLAEAESLSILLGAPVALVDRAADAPFRSVLDLIRSTGGLSQVLVLDTQAAIELSGFHACTAAWAPGTERLCLLLARSSVRDPLGLPFGTVLQPAVAQRYIPFGMAGNLERLAASESPWLDAACWCFDAMVQGLARESEEISHLRLAGILGKETFGELPFQRQLQRRRYLSLAGASVR